MAWVWGARVDWRWEMADEGWEPTVSAATPWVGEPSTPDNWQAPGTFAAVRPSALPPTGVPHPGCLVISVLSLSGLSALLPAPVSVCLQQLPIILTPSWLPTQTWALGFGPIAPP